MVFYRLEDEATIEGKEEMKPIDDREKLEKALRELVGRMFDLLGAYGGGDYEGRYEREIQNLVDAIVEPLKTQEKLQDE